MLQFHDTCDSIWCWADDDFPSFESDCSSDLEMSDDAPPEGCGPLVATPDRTRQLVPPSPAAQRVRSFLFGDCRVGAELSFCAKLLWDWALRGSDYIVGCIDNSSCHEGD